MFLSPPADPQAPLTWFLPVTGTDLLPYSSGTLCTYPVSWGLKCNKTKSTCPLEQKLLTLIHSIKCTICLADKSAVTYFDTNYNILKLRYALAEQWDAEIYFVTVHWQPAWRLTAEWFHFLAADANFIKAKFQVRQTNLSSCNPLVIRDGRQLIADWLTVLTDIKGIQH